MNGEKLIDFIRVVWGRCSNRRVK